MSLADNFTLEYQLTYEDVVEILKLVRNSSSLASLDLEVGALKLNVVRAATEGAPATAVQAKERAPRAAPDQPAANADFRRPQASADANLVPVLPPSVGMFFRASGPDAEPFVKEGDFVEAGQQIGLLEVMKLYSPVVAPVSGRLVQILVDNNTLVEHGQHLMLIDPRGARE